MFLFSLFFLRVVKLAKLYGKHDEMLEISSSMSKAPFLSPLSKPRDELKRQEKFIHFLICLEF
jgi:hypothetical protein